MTNDGSCGQHAVVKKIHVKFSLISFISALRIGSIITLSYEQVMNKL